MSEPNEISVDEYMEARKAFVRDDGTVMKATRNAPRTWDPKKRTVDFVMSAEVEDRDRDIILQAGLNIDRFVSDNPVALPMHNHRDLPIGKWSNVTKHLTGRPKRTEGTLQLMPEGVSAAADEFAAHFDFGSLRACSIGFIPSKLKRRDVPDDKKEEPYFYPGYMIEESELLECSVVNIPANPAALAKHASFGNKFALEVIEEVLDNWAKHPETGLLIPRSEFEDAWVKATGSRLSLPVSGDETGWLKKFGDMFGLTPKNPDGTITQTEGQATATKVDENQQELERQTKLAELKKTVQEALDRRELRKRAEEALKRAAAA